MRPFRIAPALVLAAALVSGCGAKEIETAAPKGIAYLCEDGRPIRVMYDGGGARAEAKLMFDGNSYEMRAAPAISGLRYASETGISEGGALVWTTDGVSGTLGEVPMAQAGLGEEREIARCERVGWEPHTVAAADAHADASHDDEAH